MGSVAPRKGINMEETQDSKKYGVMMQELEGIISKLSSQDLDLDEMVQHVDHGYQLIQKMRLRLSDTKEKLETLRLAQENDLKD